MSTKLGSGSTEFNRHIVLLEQLFGSFGFFADTVAWVICYFLLNWVEYEMAPPNNITT